jgi:replicative DNA helicase
MIQKSIIGGLIRFPKEITRLGLVPDHFQDPFCYRAYSAMVSLTHSGVPINALDVSQKMGGDSVANLESLKEFRKDVQSPTLLIHWASSLKEAFKSKQIKKLLTEAISSHEPTDVIRSRVITQMAALDEDGRNYETGGKEWMSQVVEKVEEVFQAKHHGSGTVGIKSGIQRMDEILGGFHKSDLIVMGARPKMGKTAWLMNAAKAAAMEGKKVGIASAEMPAWQLGERIVSDIANLSASVFRSGDLEESDCNALTYGTTIAKDLPIRIFDKPRMTVGDIALQTKAWELSGGIDILFVDYLTRLTPDSTENNRVREVGQMVSSLKTLARIHNIPVVCLAQLSRKVEERNDKRPMPSDLRDSGEIEQEADVIMFLYRDSVYNTDADPREAEILIEANRHGPTGRIRCTFDGEFMRWAELEDPSFKDRYAA